MPTTHTVRADCIRFEATVLRSGPSAITDLGLYDVDIEEARALAGVPPNSQRSEAFRLAINFSLPELEDFAVFVVQLLARQHRIQRALDDEPKLSAERQLASVRRLAPPLGDPPGGAAA
jgi:hypothetical protein